jgi:1-phosphofructokinase family hexose kinase
VIVSLTPNPAVDKTLLVRGLRHGAQNRADESHVDPGGKGINVSRMAHRLGRPTVALVVLGGHIGRLLARALEDEGVPAHFAWTQEETRLNAVLVDPDVGESTRIWDRGPRADPATTAELLALARRWTSGAAVFVTGGSLLPGMPDDLHATAISIARRAGAKTILDADGESFRRGLEGRPDLVKPNVRELAAFAGREVDGDAEVIRAARELLDVGPAAVVVSMGAKGSLLVEKDRVMRAMPPDVELRSAVGSGDSLVAGLAVALARGDDLVEGLRLGSAAGAATAAAVGTHLGERADVERLVPLVRIERVDVA